MQYFDSAVSYLARDPDFLMYFAGASIASISSTWKDEGRPTVVYVFGRIDVEGKSTYFIFKSCCSFLELLILNLQFSKLES